tara:strand:+ start:57 stop:1454 length:1398 start_codon:yes stop_codon:yes gene_type:complete
VNKIVQNNLILFCTILFSLSISFSLAQSNSLYIETNITNNGNKAFWMKSNRWGVYQGNRVSLNFNYNSRKFNFLSLNGDIVKVDKDLQIIEGNLSLGIKNYQFIFGKIKYLHGMADHELSSGSLIQSKNAEPIPKILLKNTNPFNFKIKKISLLINAGLSHGFIEKGDYIAQPQLHEKWANIKINKNNLSLHLGLVHNAIFGGGTNEFGLLPSSLADFIRVFFAQNGDENAPKNENINSLGNHLGTWDLGLTLDNKNYILTTYLQHPFEDQSGSRWLLNWQDGLYGLTLENKSDQLFIDKINIEFLYTLNQSGSNEVSRNTYGWDDYYNHYIYLSGWTNKGRSIGTPFAVLGSNEARKHTHIENNRIKALHLGVLGKLGSKLSFKHLSSYSINYGNFFDEDRLNKLKLYNKYSPPINQYSGMIELIINNFRMNKNISFGILYAQDKGNLYFDNSSLEISIRYHVR